MTGLCTSTTDPYRLVSIEQPEWSYYNTMFLLCSKLCNNSLPLREKQNLYRSPARRYVIHTSPALSTRAKAASFTPALLQPHWTFLQFPEHPSPVSGLLHLQYPLPAILLFLISAWLNPWSYSGLAETYLDSKQISGTTTLVQAFTGSCLDNTPRLTWHYNPSPVPSTPFPAALPSFLHSI